jgi:hypothetical protein
MLKDGVFSVIRMVDVLYVDPSVVKEDSETRVQIQLLLATKFASGAALEHTVEFKLARPDAEPVSMGGIRPVKIEVKFPGLPTGFNSVVTAGVKLKQMGTHYIFAYIDGEEVAKTPFTLQPPLTPQPD